MTFFAFAKGNKEVYDASPGLYNIPSCFGQGPKYSFKSRPREFLPQYSPKYATLPSTLSRNGVSLGRKDSKTERKVPKQITAPPLNMIPSTIGEGPKMSIHDIHSTKTEVTPGPGQYNPKNTDKGPSYFVGVGKRFDFIKDNVLVPPGAYDIPSTIQPRKTVELNKKNDSRRPKFPKKQHPGPIYNVDNPIGSDARKSAFPKGPRDMPIPKSPGPGDYNIDPNVGDSTRIFTTMHVRSKEPVLSKTDAPFYDIPSTIVPTKRSLLSRPATSYDTPSPGPAYNIPTTIVPKKRSIGLKTPQKDPVADFPGPDTYFRSDAPKDLSCDVVCPLDCSYNRDIINYKEALSLPGPGDYDSNSGNQKDAKGFTIQTRGIQDVRPDSAAPYRVLPSTLSGKAYTIGNREVFVEVHKRRKPNPRIEGPHVQIIEDKGGEDGAEEEGK